MFGRGNADKDRYARPKRKSDHASSSSSRSQRRAASASSAPPTGGTPSPQVPPPRPAEFLGQAVRSSRLVGLGLAFRLAIAAAVVAGVTIPLITTGTAGTTFSSPLPAPIIPGGVRTSAAPSPTGPNSSTPVSFLTAAGVRVGLARLARLLPGSRLALVRLDARSLIASARMRDGSFKQIVLTRAGSIETPGASTGQRLLPISSISPRAVARLVAGMTGRFHVPADRIDYIVLSSPPNSATQWIIFSKSPSHPGFAATLAGTHLRRLPG